MSATLDPRVKRTKAMFEKALLELMEGNHYQIITVQQIAKQSGLNRATFYLHYYDKDDLLEKILKVALENFKESVSVNEEEYQFANDYAHPIFIRAFSTVMENSRFYKIMLTKNEIPYFNERLAVILHEFVKDGTYYMVDRGIEFKVPIEISISYYTAAYLGTLVWWLRNDMPYTPEYMATQLTRMSTAGPYEKLT